MYVHCSCALCTAFFYFERVIYLTESRVALIGIVVSNADSVSRLNELLHANAKYIIGRMGIPYDKAGVSLISVAIDAPQDVISALSGKLGALSGVTTKTIYQKIPTESGDG